MKLYIKVVNGNILDHPVAASNLQHVFNCSEDLVHEQALHQGYLPFEKLDTEGKKVISTDGSYKICLDGVVRENIELIDLTLEEKLDLWLRPTRNYYIMSSDWTQLSDAPLTAEKKAEWAAYRQALRNMPEDYSEITSANSIIWPTKPT
jgi:hypothetical protein